MSNHREVPVTGIKEVTPLPVGHWLLTEEIQMNKSELTIALEKATAALERASTDIFAMSRELENKNVELVELGNKLSIVNTSNNEYREKITTLDKELVSAKSSNEYQRGLANKAEEQVEQVHALLDALDAPPRHYKNDNGYDKQLQPMTRLAAYLAGTKVLREPN